MLAEHVKQLALSHNDASVRERASISLARLAQCFPLITRDTVISSLLQLFTLNTCMLQYCRHAWIVELNSFALATVFSSSSPASGDGWSRDTFRVRDNQSTKHCSLVGIYLCGSRPPNTHSTSVSGPTGSVSWDVVIHTRTHGGC